MLLVMDYPLGSVDKDSTGPRSSGKTSIPPGGISADFIDILSQAMKEYEETLKGLKDR